MPHKHNHDHKHNEHNHECDHNHAHGHDDHDCADHANVNDNNKHDHGDHHEHDQHDHKAHGHSPAETKTGRLATLFNNRVTRALGKIQKPLYIGASFALVASSALIAPALALPSAAALGAGLFLMHKTSEYALDDITRFGSAAGLSGMSLGVLSGLVHSGSEAFVSAQAVIGGNTDLALSNIVGGSIVHTLGILGAAAAIAGIGDKQGGTLGWKFNTLVMAGGAGAFGGQLLTGNLWSGLSAAMLGYGGYYLYKRVSGEESCVHDHGEGAACGHSHHGHDHGHGHGHGHGGDGHDGHAENQSKLLNGTKAALSLGALIGMSHYVVKNALDLSADWNINHTVMGVVLVAAGTALSEAYLTIRAAMDKKTEFALGNVLGCNITNTLLVGGAIGALAGLDNLGFEMAEHLKEIKVPDSLNLNSLEGKINWGVFAGAAAGVTGLMAAQKGHIARKQGGVMAASYLAYVLATSHFSEPLFNCHEDFVNGEVVEHCIMPAESEKTPPTLEDIPEILFR